MAKNKIKRIERLLPQAMASDRHTMRRALSRIKRSHGDNLAHGNFQKKLLGFESRLHASIKKGNRPSYIKASKPETAIPLYEAFVDELKKTSKLKIVTGDFGANMEIDLINDGPVTILIDTKNKE